ncbi:hypothetical protein [Halochromatium sp.]
MTMMTIERLAPMAALTVLLTAIGTALAQQGTAGQGMGGQGTGAGPAAGYQAAPSAP